MSVHNNSLSAKQECAERPETYYYSIQAFCFFVGGLHCNKEDKYIYIYSKFVLIYSDYQDFKTCLGFRIHMF